MSTSPPERGAYGFTLRGVGAADELLVAAPRDWPALELAWRVDGGALPERESVGDERAELLLTAGGSVAIDRVASRAVYSLPHPPAVGALVHPLLAPVASVAARWLGRESFHAGAVVLGGGAWALLGDKEAGKSSTLAYLAREGHPVLCDDLLVLDGADGLAGPRAIDLREEAAVRLGAGEPLGRIGLRDRWRLTLGGVAAAVPLHGWIVLAWDGGAPRIDAIRGAERLRAITPHRAVRLWPADPPALVALSALPCYTLRRPHDWSSLPVVARLLAETLGSGLPPDGVSALSA